MAELPPAPRTVIPPEVPPVVKRKLPLRAVLIPVLLLSLVAGGVYLVKLTAGPTPDERATAITAAIARDALLVVIGEDKSGEASDRIRVYIGKALEGSNCQWVAGTITTGNTQAAAAANAERVIALAKSQAGEQAKDYGLGYTVVRGLLKDTDTGRHYVPDQYVAVLAAIRCSAPSPAVPGMGS